MRRVTLVLLALLAPCAFGGVTLVESTTVSLYKGTSKVGDHPSWDACQSAARTAASKITSGAATFSCKTEVRKVVGTYTVDPPPPPACTATKPADITRTQTCPSGTTGSWAQTASYASTTYPTCWVLGSYLPSLPPAGACTPIVVEPPPPTGDARKNLAVWEDFASLRKANNGADLYWDVYNGATGDAGPSQKVRGVAGNILTIEVPAGNILYVDADSPTYTNSRDWLKSHVKSGAVTDATNRLSFLVRSSIDSPRRADGGPVMDVGTYIKSLSNLASGNEGSSSTEGHFYHSFGPAFYKGRWVKFVMTNKPSHRRGGANGTNYAPVPGYFGRETRTYFTPYGYYPGNSTSTWDLAAFELYTEEGEADGDVFNLTLTYSGSRYEVTWASSKRISEKFDILYSIDGTPFKTFSGGRSGGTVANSGDDYSQVSWASPSMAESPKGFWIAIRKQGSTLFTSEYLNYQIGPGNTALPP